jgi:cytochrome P450 family 144
MTVLHDPLEFFGEQSLQDPYPLYDRLRDAGPLHRVGDSAFYVVPRWDAVEEVIARVEDFSSNLTATMVYQPNGAVTSFDMSRSADRRTYWPPLTTQRMRFTASCWFRSWRPN